MYTLILISHIIVASILTISMVTVMVAGYVQKRSRAYEAMLGSFGLTTLSGIGLLALNAGVLGHVCAMMSAFALGTIGVRYYYQKRLAQLAV